MLPEVRRPPVHIKKSSQYVTVCHSKPTSEILQSFTLHLVFESPHNMLQLNYQFNRQLHKFCTGRTDLYMYNVQHEIVTACLYTPDPQFKHLPSIYVEDIYVRQHSNISEFNKYKPLQ